MRRPVTGLIITSATLVAAILAGCHSPSGGWMPHTGGTQTYYSTERAAKIVTIIDTRTSEPVFTKEIPIGKQLTFDFVPGKGDDPVERPDLMRYDIWPIGKTTGVMRNAQSVPGRFSRMIDVQLVSGPGYAEPPPSERYRVDQVEDRPAWWTAAGGPVPDPDRKYIYDD